MDQSKKRRALLALVELEESARTLDAEVATLYFAGIDIAKAEKHANAMQQAVEEDSITAEVVYGAVMLVANAMAQVEGLTPAFRAKLCQGMGDLMAEIIAVFAQKAMEGEVEDEAPPPELTETGRTSGRKVNGTNTPKRTETSSKPPAARPLAKGPVPYTQRVNGNEHDAYLIDEFKGMDQNELPQGRAHAAIMERQGWYFMDPASVDLENLDELPPEATHVVWVQS